MKIGTFGFRLALVIKTLVFTAVTVIACLVPPGTVSADKYDKYCTGDDGDCSTYSPECSSQAVTDASVVSPGPIYIMGDSITALSKDTYEKKFKDGGWNPRVEGLSSRHIVGTPPSPDGLGQIKKADDKEFIAKAKAIVIALGTNDSGGSEATIKQNVSKIMGQLKSENTSSAPIFWVNIIDTRSDSASKKTNRAIDDAVGSDGTVIDWRGEAKSEADLASFDMGVHPTRSKDIKLLVNLVYEQVNGKAGPADGGGGGGDDCTCEGGGGSALTGKDNEEKTWNYFKGKDLSDKQVAGIMGNLMQESHFDPQVMEIGGRSKDPNDAGSGGYGLIQWTPGSKMIGQAKTAKLTGPIYELSTQLDLVWAHMHNNPIVTQPFDLEHFKTINNEVTAAEYFGEKIEGFGIAGDRWTDATDALNKHGGGGGGDGDTGSDSEGEGCGGGNTLSPQCSTAKGNAKILCEAKKYDPVSYVYGGGHGAGPKVYHEDCKTIDESQACGLDCSGLVSVAVYDAFGGDGALSWDTNSMRSDTAHWKKIDASDAKAGDVMQPNDGHVEIVDHIKGSSVHTFGAHSAGKPQPKQVGATTFTKSDSMKFYRYVGPGSQ